MVEKKLIDKGSLSEEKLMIYFENDDHKNEIIELDAKVVAKLGLISKLEAEDINIFLCNDENPENPKKMIEILKLVIGRINKNILNDLRLEYFDNELLETVVLSRYNDLSGDQISEIDFSKLTLNGQKVVLKKMADNGFKSFSFKPHWQQNINEEAWKSLNLTDWRKFVYNKILKSYKTVNPYLSKNQKILQLIPIDILSLFDTEECKNENEISAFDKFLNDNFNYWSAKQILACGNCPEDKLDRLKNKLKAENGISLSESAVKTFLSLQQIFQKFVKNKNLDNNNLSVEKMLFDFFETQLSDEKNSDNLIECVKYIFNDGENNYFAAMIIMEEFILLDENTVNSDLFHLEGDKKEKLLQISEKIKSKLNWKDEEQRKKILRQLFSNISKMNELMISFDEAVDKKSSNRFEQFIDIYKSFLNRILSMHVNDINKYNIADKVPFYFLDNEKSIKSFCRQFGDKININCFSEMLNAINKVNVENNEYRISNALGICKVLFIIDTMNQLEKESSNLDDKHNPDPNKYICGLSEFMGQIRTNAGLICDGYATNESDNSIEIHLKQYDKNGEISHDKLDSILCTMFKEICENKIKVNDFIKKYGKLDEQKLTKIKEATNDNFKAFEELMLPIIEQDYNGMGFVDFVQKYDLLKVIGIEDLDTSMISMAFDCMHRLSPKLDWNDFVRKYYISDNSNKNGTSTERDYHIKGLEDEEIQKVMTEILLNDKAIKDEAIKEVLDKVSEKTIPKLYGSLLSKNKNENIKNKIEDEKKEIENMRDEIGKYFTNVMAIKRAWDSKQRLNVGKLSKIWFAKSYGDTKLKTNKLSTMIETYKDQSTYDPWKKFSEIYILRHLSQDAIQKYKSYEKAYKEIKDLEAKANNLKEQVTLFYQRLNGETFNNNIDSICQLQFGSETIKNQFLMYVNKDIGDNFKIFVTTLEKINEIYNDDEIKKICEEYRAVVSDENKNSVMNFFSSIANRVHFVENYQTIIKKIPALDLDSTCLQETNEYKFKDAAKKILGDPLKSNFDIEKNFAVLFVRSLEKLNKVLESLKNKNQHDEEIKLLMEIYDKYKSYSDYLYSPGNIKVMFTKKNDKFEFETDFQQIQDILKKVNIQDCDVFGKCLSIFKTDVLPGYERKLKQDASFSNFIKFIETGITSGYFSDTQIYNMDIINIPGENDLKSYTLEHVIKKLPVIVGSADRGKLEKITEKLKPKNRLEYIACDSDQPDQYINAMRKLLLYMGYSKAKTFIKDYDFQVYPEIESQSEYQANTYKKRFNLFGRVLQNALLDSFRDNKYNKIDFKGKFILGECFFGSMLRQACKDEKINVTTEFDSLFEMIRNRILSVLQYPPRYDKTKFFQGEMNQRLSEAKELLGEKSFNISLNEQIARAFLSAHIYICSGHIDGNEMDKAIIDLGDEFYDKIIFMLARSTGKEEKFKDIKDIKKWVDESSLKYFIEGTFNFREIPENERTSDQMELEQTKLIEKYNERILEYILSRTDTSVFDVLENIYCNDKNKVVYSFSDDYLLKFFQDRVLPAAETGKKEDNKKHFLTLLKFLNRVKLPEKQTWVLDNLLECAKKLGLLDKSGKFVDEEALRIWIENALPMFGSINCHEERERAIMYITNHLGDNVSVLSLIDILKERSEKEPRLVYWLKDCKGFVSKLRGPYKPYKNSEKQNKADLKKKLEDVIDFLNQIGETRYSPVNGIWFCPFKQFNLLNLFPLLDNIDKTSVYDKNGTKKFQTFNDLKTFCDRSFFDGEFDFVAGNLLCFLYAISRIPEGKKLLDVVKEDKYKIDDIAGNYSREVFESAVQALYNCLSQENINDENRNEYVDFVYKFFENVKTDDFLYASGWRKNTDDQIKKLEQGKHVFSTISKIFNLVQGKNTKDSIVELSKHINNIFADERKEMEGCDYRIPILCTMFCESIKNMSIEDILSNEVKFIWEILGSVHIKKI